MVAAEDLDAIAEALRTRFGVDPRASLALRARFERAVEEVPRPAIDETRGVGGAASPLRDPAYLSAILERLRVGETRFYRDGAQLEALLDGVLDRALDAGRCRVLSAGCATGEEVWTLVALTESRLRGRGARVEVVGVDASAEAIATARAGRYPGAAVAALPSAIRRAFVERDGDVLIDPALSSRARFVVADLLDPQLLRRVGGPFDAVVCRNVLIYFDDAGARAVLGRLQSALDRDGALLVARAEVPIARKAGLVPHPIAGHGDVLVFRREGAVTASGTASPAVAPETEEVAPPSRVRLIVGPNDRGAAIAAQGSGLLAAGAPVLELTIVGPLDDARRADLGPPLRRLAAAARALGSRLAPTDAATTRALDELGVARA